MHHRTAQHVYIVMELLAGGSLADRLAEQTGNRCREEMCRALAYQLLLALRYLHSHHFLYRDVKPGNILLVGEGLFDFRVKLADFGLSKLVTEASAAATNCGSCGTNNYKAPEVEGADGKAYTSKVDVWSLGATIYKW